MQRQANISETSGAHTSTTISQTKRGWKCRRGSARERYYLLKYLEHASLLGKFDHSHESIIAGFLMGRMLTNYSSLVARFFGRKGSMRLSTLSGRTVLELASP
jgi:hypothetical protein